MLVKVTEHIWINPEQVFDVKQDKESCIIVYSPGTGALIIRDQTLDEVVGKLNGSSVLNTSVSKL